MKWKPFRKAFSELFGFDRRERRATFILASILLVMLVIRFTVGETYGLRSVPGELSATLAEASASPDDNAAREMKQELFVFDPNSVSYDELLLLGLNPRQANTLINYRNSGARFSVPADIGRVYGIDSATTERLKTFVVIKDVNTKEGGTRSVHETARSVDSTVNKYYREMTRPDPLLDLNRCSATDLERLPGIGVVLSGRVVKYRELLGGFVSVSQLKEVYGIDSVIYELIEKKVFVSDTGISIISLDSCTFGRMARHPYFGPDMARSIIRYRELMGVPVSNDDLVRQKVISPAQADKIRPYTVAVGEEEKK